MARLIEIENNIKKLIEEDINNPKVYDEIFNLSHKFLMRKKLLSSAESAEEVAHIMAEDLYMKILSGNPIHSWLGYINKYYHGAIRTWRRMCGSEIIDTTDDLPLQDAIISMSTTDTTLEYEKVLDSAYIDSIVSVVDFVLNESRYNEYTHDYVFGRMSILISLCRGYFVDYNLNTDEIPYTRFLYNKIKLLILKGIKRDNCLSHNGSLTLLQLYTLSNADIESE